MKKESDDPFIQTQTRLKLQVHAVEQLEAEFLSFLWTNSIAESQLEARFERLNEFVQISNGLEASLIMHLFARLEQKAINEIEKPLVLVQTTEPEIFNDLHPELPQELITNTQAVHTTAYKNAQSRQAVSAAKKDRPKARHLDRESVEKIYLQHIESGKLDLAVWGAKTKFAKKMLNTFPDIKSIEDVFRWIRAMNCGK